MDSNGEKGIYPKNLDNIAWYIKNLGKKIISPYTGAFDEIVRTNENELHLVGQKNPKALIFTTFSAIRRGSSKTSICQPIMDCP